MRILFYEAEDEASVEKFVKAVQDLPPKKKYKFKVEEIRPIRSLGQNKLFHAIIRLIAIETGHAEDEIDGMFRMARHYEDVFYPSGKVERIPRKTSNLDTKEFSAMMNNLFQWCQDEWPAVRIPRKEDLTYERWEQINANYEQTFSGF